MSHATLYFQPSLITSRYLRRKERSAAQIQAFRRNFTSNDHQGRVSRHTARKIRLAIQWLVFLARAKKVTCPDSKKTFTYKVGLATVSLPSGADSIEPHFFRKVLLTALLDAMRYHFGLRNYIWKIERQNNGRLHAHITLDQYIPHTWLNQFWNATLKKHGILDHYHRRFSVMTQGDYIRHRLKTDHQKQRERHPSHAAYIESIIQAYRKGCEADWYRPNTTDIRSVRNIRNLAAYMVKYLSKDPNLGDGWKGRFWSCSHALSKLRSTAVQVPFQDLPHFSKSIDAAVEKDETMFFYLAGGQDIIEFGALYFLKRSLRAILAAQPLRDLRALIMRFYHQDRIADMPHLAYIRAGDHYQLHSITQNPLP